MGNPARAQVTLVCSVKPILIESSKERYSILLGDVRESVTGKETLKCLPFVSQAGHRRDRPSWNKCTEAWAAEAEQEMLRHGVCREGRAGADEVGGGGRLGLTKEALVF